MQSPTRLSSFGYQKSGRSNAVAPMLTPNGDQNTADASASVFRQTSNQQGDACGPKSLRNAGDVGADASPNVFSIESPLMRSSGDDEYTNSGTHQSRLAAQLASKAMRRPSLLQKKSLSLREIENEDEGELGPWGVLKNDPHQHAWWSRTKQRVQRYSQALIAKPGSARLQQWFYLCVTMALVSGWQIPFHVAFFGDGGALSPYRDWVAVIEYISAGVFLADLIVKFCTAYIDEQTGVLITSRRKIARYYVHSWQFVMDVAGCFPYDWILIEAVAASDAGRQVRMAMAWIKLLKLVRMYRVFELFADLDYRMVLSQGALMLTRNYTYIFFVTHWAACILYHIADGPGFSPNSWVGRNRDRFEGKPLHIKYLLSLYFSISAFTSLGDGMLYAGTVSEAAFMVLYLLFNMFLSAYILGTVTMLVVKGDERSKQFRDRMSNLNDFSKMNELPQRLQTAMQEHLEVTFNTEQLDDERVLGIYPTTIRRKVLRHLYLHPVKNCFLFKGCKQRFLDALLTVAHVELFMPGVQLLTEGDNVTELNIIVSGEVLVAESGINLSAMFSQFASTDASNKGMRRWASSNDGAAGMKRTASIGRTASLSRTASLGRNPSASGGSIKDFLLDGPDGFMEIASGKKVVTRTCSDALAEVPFFTDVPSNETIMSTSVVRVLSLPKAAWESLMHQFPQQTRLVLTNLQTQAELELEHELLEAADITSLSEERLKVGLQHMRDKRSDQTDYHLIETIHDNLTHAQIDHLHKLEDVRAVVRAHVRKVDQVRTFEFLGCASDGDVEMLRTMLNQGMNPNSADYDGRTGLMLAASGGHEAVVRLLLDSGARSDQLDAFGNSAMAEAVKNAHDEVIDCLLSYGATLAMDAMAVASVMCTAVFEGDLVKLRRLLRSGAPPDACDYDRRSALHIAGAEGNVVAVKLLVEEGGADPNFQDRWGNTALDEARRVGATPVVAYLESLLGSDQLAGAGQRYRQQVAKDFLAACGTGDVARVRFIAHNSMPGCIFTGLVLAASKGHKDVVEVLLVWIPGEMLLAEGHLALVEAARMGHCQVVVALRACGIKLHDPRDATLQEHMRSAVLSADVRAVAAMLVAGIDATTMQGGGSLLHTAVLTGSLELVRRLVEEGGMRPSLEDATGKTPAAVAEAAKLTTLAEYLRWATSMSASNGGGVQGGLAAVAALRFGALPDYTAKDTHDELDHAVTIAEGNVGEQDDDDDLPLLIAAQHSANSHQAHLAHPLNSAHAPHPAHVGPHLPHPPQKSADPAGHPESRSSNSFALNRQASVPRASALWKMSSLPRRIEGSGALDGLSDSGPPSGPIPAAGHSRTSLTGFLAGHRVDAKDDDTDDDDDDLAPPGPVSHRVGSVTGRLRASGSFLCGNGSISRPPLHLLTRSGSIAAMGNGSIACLAPPNMMPPQGARTPQRLTRNSSTVRAASPADGYSSATHMLPNGGQMAKMSPTPTTQTNLQLTPLGGLPALPEEDDREPRDTFASSTDGAGTAPVGRSSMQKPPPSPAMGRPSSRVQHQGIQMAANARGATPSTTASPQPRFGTIAPSLLASGTSREGSGSRSIVTTTTAAVGSPARSLQVDGDADAIESYLTSSAAQGPMRKGSRDAMPQRVVTSPFTASSSGLEGLTSQGSNSVGVRVRGPRDWEGSTTQLERELSALSPPGLN